MEYQRLLEIDPESITKIRMAMAEDRSDCDVTSLWSLPGHQPAQAVLLSRQSGVLCGCDLFAASFALHDSASRTEWLAGDGDCLEPGQRVAVVSGNARSLLTAERTALNLLGRFSGVATQTAAYVSAVAHTSAGIIDTRKTCPLWRRWDKYAVRVGGGGNHRNDLASMVLLKDNHLAMGGGISAVLESVQKANRQGVPVEVEVDNLSQLAQVLEIGADRILLDNMPPETLREAVRLIDGRAETEASGGVVLENVVAIAESGVDLISIGALTHSVKNFDFSLEVNMLKN